MGYFVNPMFLWPIPFEFIINKNYIAIFCLIKPDTLKNV